MSSTRPQITASVSPPRTRLTPDARRAQLVQSGRDLIAVFGLGGFTIEAVAADAGVSVQLVYSYFGNRTRLLQRILEVEYERFQADVATSVAHAERFEDVVRVFVTMNFEHRAPRSVIAELSAQPEIYAAIDERQQVDDLEAGHALFATLSRDYTIDPILAEFVLHAVAGASQAAAGHTARRELSREQAISKAVEFVLAGVAAVHENPTNLRTG